MELYKNCIQCAVKGIVCIGCACLLSETFQYHVYAFTEKPSFEPPMPHPTSLPRTHQSSETEKVGTITSFTDASSATAYNPNKIYFKGEIYKISD